MDQDQDLLDQLERHERGGVAAATIFIAGLSLMAGAIGYFTLRLELSSSQELSIDGAALIAIASIAGLLVAYRKSF
jgi:hypothetical protein